MRLPKLTSSRVKDEKYEALEAEFRRSKKATLVPPGEPHFVHILTPEAAEKDRSQLKKKLDDTWATLETKDARIKELEDEGTFFILPF